MFICADGRRNVPALIEMSIYAKDGSTGDPRIDVQDKGVYSYIS
jgi:hypothetical protein